MVQRGVEYSWDRCWGDYVFLKATGMVGAAVVGVFSSRQLEQQAGPFAPEPAAADLEASRRWDAYVGRVAKDLKHHDWASVLEALPEDPA